MWTAIWTQTCLNICDQNVLEITTGLESDISVLLYFYEQLLHRISAISECHAVYILYIQYV